MQAKRKLAALLSLCMVLGMLPMTVFAAGETTAEGLVYEVNGESVTITGYTGNEASVVIPNEIEGKPVTAIGKAAFFNCGNLTSIEIPEGIESTYMHVVLYLLFDFVICILLIVRFYKKWSR